MEEWPEDLPKQLKDVPAVLCDYNTGAEIASGNANISFVPHTDRLRPRRQLFEGVFVPEDEAAANALRQKLISGLSAGAPALYMYVQVGSETWAFVIKPKLGDLAFPFTGRAEPTRV